MKIALFVLILAALSSCGEPKKASDVLATVGEEQITIEDFDSFATSIPDGMKAGDSPLESNRSLLQSLIDKTVLLTEAQSLDLENDPAFVAQEAKEVKSKIFGLYQQREIINKISISDEELEEHQRATHRDRALRFSGIMVETKEEAEEIIAKLNAGEDFQELAAKHSVHRETAERGGDSGGYKLRDQTIPTIAESVFPLAVGEITEPIPVSHEQKVHFVVFKIFDELPVSLDASYQRVKEEVFARKRGERITELLEFINNKYKPEILEENMGLLAKLSDAGNDDPLVLPGDEGQTPLVNFVGGEITLDEFLHDAKEAHVNPRDFAKPAEVTTILNRIFIPAHLFMSEAYEMGIDKDPTIAEHLAQRKPGALLTMLRKRQVDQYVDVTEDEARAFYDANPKKFIPPATTTAAEILVASDTLAQRVKRLLQEGQDPQTLYDQYSLREEAAHHSGRLDINAYNQAFFPEIAEIVQNLEIGQVGGPVKTGAGYSVFKILERKQEKAPYNRESKRRSMAYVKVDKARRNYVDYVRSLREKHSVSINEENLTRMSAEPKS